MAGITRCTWCGRFVDPMKCHWMVDPDAGSDAWLGGDPPEVYDRVPVCFECEPAPKEMGHEA